MEDVPTITILFQHIFIIRECCFRSSENFSKVDVLRAHVRAESTIGTGKCHIARRKLRGKFGEQFFWGNSEAIKHRTALHTAPTVYARLFICANLTFHDTPA